MISMPLHDAIQHLARMMMNQVGEEWQDCVYSAEQAAKRFRYVQGEMQSDDYVITMLQCEAYRYEDM